MRAIQPKIITVNGFQHEIDHFNLYIMRDNLMSAATFYYNLIETTQTPSGPRKVSVDQGDLLISGSEYTNWGSTGDTNEEAYVWAANRLDLTLI